MSGHVIMLMMRFDTILLTCLNLSKKMTKYTKYTFLRIFFFFLTTKLFLWRASGQKLTIFQLIANSVPFWSAIENYTFLFFEFFRCPWSRDTTNLHPHNQNWGNGSYLHCARLSQSWSGLVQRWGSFRGKTRNFRPSGQQAFHYSNWHQRANLRCLQMQSH